MHIYYLITENKIKRVWSTKNGRLAGNFGWLRALHTLALAFGNMVIKFVFITKSGWCWLSIVQPQIVIVGDPYDIDLLYIITARGKCNLSAPTRKKLEYSNWVTWLIYIFNLSYNLSKAILTFLEEAFLEIGCRQTLATVFSFFNDLANAWGSPCWNVMFW